MVLGFRGAKNIGIYGVVLLRECQKHHLCDDFLGPRKYDNKMCCKNNNNKKNNKNKQQHKNATKRCVTSCGMKSKSYCALHLRARAEHMNNTNAHTTIHNYPLWHRRCAKLYNMRIYIYMCIHATNMHKTSEVRVRIQWKKIVLAKEEIARDWLKVEQRFQRRLGQIKMTTCVEASTGHSHHCLQFRGSSAA